ncbi:MAG: LPS export ABC transporter ATP-binding protein [Spirochaetales bacterium]|nr:LPS export ABC transporter ATP-binding protein [Spirochaetales bacterium]
MADTLTIDRLCKSYGRKKVVCDISFEMTSGQIVGLLGPNGAGKTTTFYMIVGFIRSDSGRILLNGTNITRLPMYKRSILGISYLPQEASIFRKLSVWDNIALVSETRDDLNKTEKKEMIEGLVEKFGLQSICRQKGYTLSGGERRRTEIARCLACNPSFLLLDEPFAGIDPKAIYEIKQIVRTLASEGIGILLTDHNVRDALSITTVSHIISQGSILVSGTKDDLLANKEAKDIYFGDAFEED